MTDPYLFRRDDGIDGLRCQFPVSWTPDGLVWAHRRCGHGTDAHRGGNCIECIEQNMPDTAVRHEMTAPDFVGVR